jgi:importin subunit beta-1
MQLCGAVVGDAVLEHIMPLVMQNITNQDWHLREAATYAFGAIMDGCSVEAVGQYAAQSLPTLVKMVHEEQHSKTRETAAWTLSRVCEYQYPAVPKESMDHIVRAALTGLGDQQGGVCHQCCTILHKIALNQSDTDENAPTNMLSGYFNTVLQELTKTSGRPDHQENNLRMASHEALNLWIENSAVDCLQTITALLPPILQRLQSTLTMQLSEQTELHPRLLSTVNVCLNRLDSSDTNVRPNLALNFCDQVMQAALTILSSNNDAPVAEAECLLVIMAVITATEENFAKYLSASYPFIKKAIEKTDAINVSKCAIAIMGDAAASLGQQMLPYCDDIMESFVKILRNGMVEKAIKLTVFTSFGSIALSIGPSFEKYLPVVMTLMREAASVQLGNTADEETLEYMTDLRSEIMSSYTCILQGMNDHQRQAQLLPYIQGMFEVIQTVVAMENGDDEVMNHTVGLVGDMAEIFGNQISGLLQQYQAPIQKCLNIVMNSDDNQVAQFAQQKITLAVSGGN